MASGLVRTEEDPRACRFYSQKTPNPNLNPNKKRKKPRDDAVTERKSSQTLAATTEDNNSYQRQLEAAASDDSSSRNPVQPSPQKGRGPVNGSPLPGYAKSCKLVRVNLDSRSKHEIRELKRKLIGELDQVKSLIKRLEAKDNQIGGCSAVEGYANSQFSVNDAAPPKAAKLMRVHSEVGSVGAPVSRPFPGLSVSVADSNNGAAGEFTEKERKNPKIPGKGKFPPPQSNKKMKKPSGGSKDRGHEFGSVKLSGELLKTCSGLLNKLMKHKYGWVFNNPVDVEGLGLHDYYTIVKHPMDLGTVQSRLNKNWYKSPREFAEDVRLTFTNAMLYNPKGQDVHFMADTLLKMFEEKWALIEKEHNLHLKRDVVLPTPTSKKTLPTLPSRALPPEPRTKPSGSGQQVRDPIQKKPKAKDSEKKEMTYEDKQRLSNDLQDLPSEKLEDVVQIIKKRNPHLFQQEDEIEVDIDCVDLETLWELNRFVTNHKMSLSKINRNDEDAPQASAEPGHPFQESVRDQAVAPAETQVENLSGAVENNDGPSSPVREERQGGSASLSSSSGSSSSDSGSSSLDSDSDGSS